MKIYTKTGDKGDTGLWGGSRVPKDDLRIRTYGTVDELNAVLGFCLAQKLGQPLQNEITRVQSELFQLGSELSTPRGVKVTIPLISEKEIQTFEKSIDAMEKKLKPLKNFILPGGSLQSAALHLARTVCRRAERELVTLHRAEPQRLEVIQYLNRLSDYLFVAARFSNVLKKKIDTPWLTKTK